MTPTEGLPAQDRAAERANGGGRRRLLGAAALSLVLGAGVIWTLQHKASAKAATVEPPRDVPHVEGKAVVFSTAFGERAGVRFGTVSEVALTPVLQVVGTVTFDPAHQAAVGTRTRGLVKRVFKVEGDHVKEGDILAEVVSADLGEAQSALATAEAQLSAAEMHEKREAQLVGQELSTARELEEARAALAGRSAAVRAARQRVATLSEGGGSGFGIHALRAPIAGSLIERAVSPGQTVEPAVVAFRVANLTHLWVELHVFERSIGLVHEGDAVEIAPLSNPKDTITGRVAHVGHTIDLSTRSAEVRVTVANADLRLRPGQSVMATIRTAAQAGSAISVPVSAITYVDGRPVVFVAESETRVLPTDVEVGSTDGTQQQILAGLRAGQRVLVEGVFPIKSELFR